LIEIRGASGCTYGTVPWLDSDQQQLAVRLQVYHQRATIEYVKSLRYDAHCCLCCAAEAHLAPSECACTSGTHRHPQGRPGGHRGAQHVTCQMRKRLPPSQRNHFLLVTRRIQPFAPLPPHCQCINACPRVYPETLTRCSHCECCIRWSQLHDCCYIQVQWIVVILFTKIWRLLGLCAYIKGPTCSLVRRHINS
jgi:hypothetical protein